MTALLGTRRRCIYLTGAGGIGKTGLAVAVRTQPHLPLSRCVARSAPLVPFGATCLLSSLVLATPLPLASADSPPRPTTPSCRHGQVAHYVRMRHGFRDGVHIVDARGLTSTLQARPALGACAAIPSRCAAVASQRHSLSSHPIVHQRSSHPLAHPPSTLLSVPSPVTAPPVASQLVLAIGAALRLPLDTEDLAREELLGALVERQQALVIDR